MTDHRRVLREMLAADSMARRGQRPWMLSNEEHAALTAALAALEDRARLRERPVFLRERPVFQRDGDGMCFAACLSSLTDIPFEAWPALGPDVPSTDFWDKVYAVVHAHGWELARTGSAPAGYAIADGDGPRGMRHSVVVCDGAMIHDPHPAGGGLKGEPICYWIPVKLALLPAGEPHSEQDADVPFCQAVGPAPQSYSCTKPAGHAGAHEARAMSGRLLGSWPGEPPKGEM